MARSDFNLIPIGHKFTVNAPTVTKEFPIEGTKDILDDGYILIEVQGVGRSTHRIQINNVDLPGVDLPPAPGGSQAFLVVMNRIHPNTLRLGTNSITITRQGNDDFEITNVVINWRERD